MNTNRQIPTDLDLVLQYQQNGSNKSFTVLVKRYSKSLFSRIYSITKEKHLSEDLLQNVFLKASEAIKEERFSYPFNVNAWLTAIARNEAINNYRKSMKKNQHLMDLNPEMIYPAVYSPEDIFVGIEMTEILHRAIGKLSNGRGEMIGLLMAGYNYEEISEMLQIPLGTVKSGIHFGRAELKTILSNHHASDYSPTPNPS